MSARHREAFTHLPYLDDAIRHGLCANDEECLTPVALQVRAVRGHRSGHSAVHSRWTCLSTRSGTEGRSQTKDDAS